MSINSESKEPLEAQNTLDKWAAWSEKVPLNLHKCPDSDHPMNAQSLDLCSLFIHSEVSDDSVSRQ